MKWTENEPSSKKKKNRRIKVKDLSVENQLESGRLARVRGGGGGSFDQAEEAG